MSLPRNSHPLKRLAGIKGWLRDHQEVLCVLVVQFALLCLTFPVSELFSTTPLLHTDSPFHWFKMEEARGFAAGWTSQGFDPYFDAGFLGGIDINAAMKMPALIGVITAPWLDAAIVYKLYVFSVALLGPPCVPLAMRWYGLGRRATFWVAGLALLVWWLSALRWYETAGMASYVFCVHLALPYSVFLIRYLVEPLGRRAILVSIIVGAVGLFTHPLFPVAVAFLLIAMGIARWRDISMRKLPIVLVVIPAMCLLPNIWWMASMFEKTAFNSFVASQPYQRAVGFHIVWQEALGEITTDARGSRINPMLWLGALLSCAVKGDGRDRRLAIAITLASTAMILFADFAAAIKALAPMQPNRFSAAAYLYLCIPAGVGSASLFRRWAVPGAARIATGIGIAAAIGCLAFLGRELVREISFADIPHHGATPPIVRGVGPNSQWVLAWLSSSTDSDARVLFQESPGPTYDYAHMASYFAITSGREFLGDMYPHTLFLGFDDKMLFQRPIQSWSPQELDAMFQRYNVGWVIAYTDAAKSLLDRLPLLMPGPSKGPIKTYAYRTPHSFFLGGSGRVVGRGFGYIELDDVVGQAVTLKYHYVPGLVAKPSGHIEPFAIPGDPMPLIRVIDPPRRLLLTTH